MSETLFDSFRALLGVWIYTDFQLTDIGIHLKCWRTGNSRRVEVSHCILWQQVEASRQPHSLFKYYADLSRAKIERAEA